MVKTKRRKCKNQLSLKKKYKNYAKKKGLWAAYIKQMRDVKRKKTRRRRLKSFKK